LRDQDGRAPAGAGLVNTGKKRKKKKGERKYKNGSGNGWVPKFRGSLKFCYKCVHRPWTNTFVRLQLKVQIFN